LYKLSKAVGMNAQHVVNLLRIANNYIPSVRYRYEKTQKRSGTIYFIIQTQNDKLMVIGKPKGREIPGI
jgi:hypothetical protein